MLRNYRRLFAAAATVAVAVTIAVTGITGASAAPRTSPAVSGPSISSSSRPTRAQAPPQ